jgi:nucleoid-associated protein YgaU
MFEPNSRYYSLEETQYTTSDGRKIAYKRRRFLPQGRTMPLLVEVTMTQGDRLDLIAHRTLGDSQQFWRICDANNAMKPADLTAELNQIIRVPLPQSDIS